MKLKTMAINKFFLFTLATATIGSAQAARKCAAVTSIVTSSADFLCDSCSDEVLAMFDAAKAGLIKSVHEIDGLLSFYPYEDKYHEASVKLIESRYFDQDAINVLRGNLFEDKNIAHGFGEHFHRLQNILLIPETVKAQNE